jgi:hypothetical protein
VNTVSGAVTTVCTFASQDSLRVIAFFDRTRIGHFYGSATPVMELLSTTNLGATSCAVTRVAAYTSAATSAFQGAPVLAATLDAQSSTARVLLVAGSPAMLFAVTPTGALTTIGALKSSSNSPLSPYALAFTQPRPSGQCT